MDRTLDRLAPLTGALFTVFALVAFVGLGGDTPDSGDAPAKVVAFYTKHQDQQTIASLVLLFGVIALIFFAGSLRQAFLGPEPGAERRASIAYGAALLTAGGIALMAGSHFALADNAHKISPQAAEALNALEGGTWTVAFTGMAALTLSSAVLILTTRRLPAWLGWSALVIGIATVTPIGFIFAGLGIIWVGIMGIVLWRRTETVSPATQAVPPAAPAGSPA
jgi:uncharacterized membrane protein YhaH (DUF805 family)